MIEQSVTIDPERRALLMRRATRASVAVALVLVGLKAVAWVYTGSVALLGSVFDSALDAVASVMVLLAVGHALSPADREHRFGHGKAEAIAGLGQAALILGSAGYLFYQAVNHFLYPHAIAHSRIGIGVTVLAIILTGALVRYQRFVARETGSLAVSADSAHYASDLLMNGGVILAFMISDVSGWLYADPLMGAIIAAMIAKGALGIIRPSYDTLMDREMGDAERTRISAIVLGRPEVRGIHDLRTRRSGIDSFIQFHLELDPALTLAAAHAISDRVQLDIGRAFPAADVIIHIDPAGVETPHDVIESGLARPPGLKGLL